MVSTRFRVARQNAVSLLFYVSTNWGVLSGRKDKLSNTVTLTASILDNKLGVNTFMLYLS